MKNCSLAINKAGWPFIGILALVTWGLTYLGWQAGMIGTILTLWCVYFFRDPTRVTPKRNGLVVSPADGRIIAVQEVVPEADLGLGTEPRMRISIFLNIFDVHINRIPADGTIIAARYRAGKFLHAASDKASVDNERMAVVEELAAGHPYSGQKLGFVQIAGLIARRIVCKLEPNQKVAAGERYGLIRFGSRAEIYLPPKLQPLVTVGQYMIGGETVLADCASTESFREGEVR
jgi:phosphatidylserine decarboxylase